MKSKLRRRVRGKRKSVRVRRSASAGALTARSEAKQQSDGNNAVLIGGAHDPAEKAADNMAQQVMAGGPVSAGPVATGTPANSGIHRACAKCDEEKEAKRNPQTTTTVAAGSKAAHASSDASSTINSMGPGRSLAKSERAFFEPRFRRDFSNVRIHDGATADRAARGIDARAFTYGDDIGFAKDEKKRGGKALMAHELAHVAQGGNGAQRLVKRATMADADGHKKYKKVPDTHRDTVQKALDLIDTALKAKRCKDFFKDKCTGGTAATAQSTFSASTVYYLADHTTRFGLSDIRKVAADPHVVAYNQYAYDVGRWEIAATLLHEMFHTCDMSVDDMDEILAEKATETCGFYAPWITKISPTSLDVGDTLKLQGYQFGQKQDADHYVRMGGTRITDYKHWEQPKGASSVRVEFEVPKSVNDNYFLSRDVETAVVNHGHDSNKKTINVDT
jgi:hypothetical protein